MICDQTTTLCLQLDDSYEIPIIFFNSESNSDSLIHPHNINLNNVQCNAWPEHFYTCHGHSVVSVIVMNRKKASTFSNDLHCLGSGGRGRVLRQHFK